MTQFSTEPGGHVRIGVGLANQLRGADPARLADRAAMAERLGFSSVATVGRVAFPGVMDTVALAVAAGVTKSVGLFTGVLVAPAWRPAVLAKELASIEVVSGHRLTVGIGIGSRDDDYPDGRPAHRGRRLDHDLETYRRVWADEGDTSSMPDGARAVPLMFGGVSDAALRRMARHGVGFVGPSWPAGTVAPLVDAARAAWAAAGRPGECRVTALTYSALRDPDAGASAMHDYYGDRPPQIRRQFVEAVARDAGELRRTVGAYRDLGVDELIVNPAIPDEQEYAAVADAVL